MRETTSGRKRSHLSRGISKLLSRHGPKGIELLSFHRTALGAVGMVLVLSGRMASAQFADNFAVRSTFSGSSIAVTGTLAGATLEAGEPACLPTNTAIGSVWCSWVASESTPVTVAVLLDCSP
jgi:hypothetical protein